MNTLARTGDSTGIASEVRRGGRIALALWICTATSTVAAQNGQVQCIVSENGLPARGSFVVEQSGRQVASGSCARLLSVPAGASEVTVRLEGALDNPAQTLKVNVVGGETAPARVDFETAVLEVRVETNTRRGTAIVAVEKAGRRIGTIASGVPATLSAGSYEVLVRVDGQERRTAVDLRPGQRRVVRTRF